MPRSESRRSVSSLVVGALAVMGLVVAVGIVGRIFDVSLPFSTTEKDHSPALVLTEIRTLAEFTAAEAEFEVIVDRERDVKWVPAFVAGDRVQFVAVGTVAATVDFSDLGAESVLVDGDTATIILPAPAIGDPVVDLERSGVMNRDRGVLDRLGGLFVDNPTAEISLIEEAEDKMAAAVPSTDLLDRAEDSATETLSALVRALGIENVRVVFERPDLG